MVHVPSVTFAGVTHAAAKVYFGSRIMRQKHKTYKVPCMNGLAGFIIFILKSLAGFNKPLYDFSRNFPFCVFEYLCRPLFWL